MVKKKIGHVKRRKGTIVYVDRYGDVYETERAGKGKKRR